MHRNAFKFCTTCYPHEQKIKNTWAKNPVIISPRNSSLPFWCLTARSGFALKKESGVYMRLVRLNIYEMS